MKYILKNKNRLRPGDACWLDENLPWTTPPIKLNHSTYFTGRLYNDHINELTVDHSYFETIPDDVWNIIADVDVDDESDLIKMKDIISNKDYIGAINHLHEIHGGYLEDFFTVVE